MQKFLSKKIFRQEELQKVLSKEIFRQEELKKAKQDLQALDVALSDWLNLLQLPQLAEETKRQEVASKLRTVLIEKLMRQKVPE